MQFRSTITAMDIGDSIGQILLFKSKIKRCHRERIILFVLVIYILNRFCVTAEAFGMSSAQSPPQINATIARQKRYLDFIPKSRMFFRSNVKANVLSANQVLAFAYGFRANYPIENDRKIRRRDVYDGMEEMIDHHGLNGQACILKLICDMNTASSNSDTGIFYRLYRFIFKRPGNEQDTYSLRKECDRLTDDCSLNLLTLTPYTDL